MDDFNLLLDDLVAEHRALEDVLARMSDPHWDLATHAPGWFVRDQVTHLAHFDEAATLAIADAELFRADVAARAAGDARQSYERRYLAPGARDAAGRTPRVVARAGAELVAAARAVRRQGAAAVVRAGDERASRS